MPGRLRERQGPRAKEILERVSRRPLEILSSAGRIRDQPGERLSAKLFNAKAQKEVGGPSAAMAAPEPRSVVIRDDERIGRRLVQEPGDAIIEIRPTPAEQAFGTVGDAFVQPVLLVGKLGRDGGVGG